MHRQGIELCAADGFGWIGTRGELTMDRVKNAMRVLVSDRGERADDIAGARGEKSAAEAQREGL